MDSNCFQGSPSSSRRICKYDVFLSFRGDDTRNNFTDHLYNHLIRKGIFTFKDDKKLEKGQPISPQLLQAIRDSRVSIVVFSRDYAASTWCLDEMAAIVDCQQELKQAVFPVFYDVDPSHVRKQNGVYEDAFVLHAEKFKEDPGKVDRWKRAMTGLANSAGWDVKDKPEFREIEKIVQKVIKTLDHKFSGFADDLIGIQPRVERLEELLKLSSEDDEFRVLGISGMGGIGKTTHATVLYNRISNQFDACCFIENVSQIYKDGGALAVQKKILHQTLDEKNLDTYSPSEVSGIIANRLHKIKVLVALDNVDQLEQLQKLAINPKLLCAGSRIIITTRNEHILKVYGADEVHNVPLLSNDDARELFCRKAFKRSYSNNSCEELIPEVLKYAQSLPLAIRVVGSFLCTRDVSQWRDALDRLGDDPDDGIMDVLQISFEGLQSREKEIFLHIACFFRGEREDYVKRILDGCGLYPHIGIPVIMEKSLITIRNQEIHMHEMLQELGKKITRGKYLEEPGSWSRLWRYKDFHRVLMEESGTNNIKAIVLNEKEDVPKCSQLKSEGLSKMMGLKLLILYHNDFSGSLTSLSNRLQYLSWHGYPFSSLPLNFEPYDSLVELNFPGSGIKKLWEGRKSLPSLQRMDLSNSKYLLETPNFEWSPNIVRLDFTGCTNLQHVHPSIGLLGELAFLSFQNCSNLVSLDLSTNYKLSMRVLHLSGCTKLKNTPDFSGLVNLEHLDLEQCSNLSTVHDSIGALKLLKFLSLRGCKELCIIPRQAYDLRSLITLDLSGCVKLNRLQSMDSDYMSSLIILDLGFCNLIHLPFAFRELRCLERLNLEGNNFDSILCAISQLDCLAYLNLSHCKRLESIPEIPSKNTSPAGKYFKLVSGSRNHRSGLYAFNCPNIINDTFDNVTMAFLWLQRLVQEPSHFRGGFDIVVSGTEIPEWFEHEFGPGSAIRIVPSDADDNWIGFAFCVAFGISYGSPNSGSSDNSFSSQQTHPLYLSFEGEHVEECFHMPLRLELDQIQGSKQEHLWLIYIARQHCHFVKTGAHITFKAHLGVNIRKWGLRTVFNSTDFRLVNWLGRKRLKRDNEKNDETNQVNCLPFDYARESYNGSAGPKFQLPYNWLVSEQEENEKMEAEQKENSFSNVGLCKRGAP